MSKFLYGEIKQWNWSNSTAIVEVAGRNKPVTIQCSGHRSFDLDERAEVVFSSDRTDCKKFKWTKEREVVILPESIGRKDGIVWGYASVCEAKARSRPTLRKYKLVAHPYRWEGTRFQDGDLLRKYNPCPGHPKHKGGAQWFVSDDGGITWEKSPCPEEFKRLFRRGDSGKIIPAYA